MELGVQSYCLRGIRSPSAVAEAVHECGLRRIELCAVHADFSAPEEFVEVAESYEKAGVKVVSIGVNRIGTSEEEARSLFECARAVGLSRMSVDFPLEGVDEACRIADSLSEEYGILLGIHNHGGKHWLGSSTALRWVFGKTSERIGLSLDTAWAIDSREDPVGMVKEFGARLHLVHLKDFLYEPDRTPRDVIVGSGNLRLRDFDIALADTGFSGEAILEYEGDVQDPVPALARCVTEISSQMRVVTVPGN
ncbi:MAG: sugar phosphate isomerase/epimerase family protein [Spirochaetota bacterium]